MPFDNQHSLNPNEHFEVYFCWNKNANFEVWLNNRRLDFKFGIMEKINEMAAEKTASITEDDEQIEEYRVHAIQLDDIKSERKYAYLVQVKIIQIFCAKKIKN